MDFVLPFSDGAPLTTPLLLCAGKNLQLQSQSAYVPRGPGSGNLHSESSHGGKKNQQTNPCVKEGCRSWCLLASAYLHNDLVHFAMSDSIRFEDGNSVGFIGWNYGWRSSLCCDQ